MKKLKWKAGLLASAAAASFVINGRAQSVDALLDKLVDKGVLTVNEAKSLREETDQKSGATTTATTPTAAPATKSSMPDWITSFKWGGDLRGRFEDFSSSNPVFDSQDRFRYRFRLGATLTMLDDFEVGFRLGSGNLESGLTAGSDPLSSNQTYQNNASKKGVFIDLAYATWSPLHNHTWALSTTLGKMENPFVFTDMVFDPDYTPEGGAAQIGYKFNERHELKLIGAAFIVDNNAQLTAQPYSAENPFLTGGQLLLNSSWNKRLSTSAGLAILGITGADALGNLAVPNGNQGNTRDPITTAPTYAFSPLVASASTTYRLDEMPLYPGAFPIRIGGEYMYNSGAPAAADNYGYNVGIQFGKAGKKGTWELSYTWKWLGANAWYEELVDSDFGALYQQTQPNSGFLGPNYGSGTDVKGNVVKLAYSPYDFVTVSAKWFYTWLIVQYPDGSDSSMSRLQLDATIKF